MFNNINYKKIKPKTEYIAQKVIYFKSIDSTNNEAKKTDCENGTLFISEVQTCGKGRMGREWDSKKNEGIYMSLVLKPNIISEQTSFITLVTGLAVCKTLTMLYNLPFQLKWPNDVVIGNKKICGILVEAVTEKNKSKIINGIGINVNQKKFPEELKNKATSLYLLTGEKKDRLEIINKLWEVFEKNYNCFLLGKTDEILKEYEKNCVTLNREISVIKDGEEVNAIATGISQSGELIAKKTDGTTLKINSGEVSVQGIY